MMEKNEISTKKINSEMFIDAVRKHPCLYDKSLSEFKDTSYKKTIWTAIGIAFGITGKFINDLINVFML